ncbi:MAG: serine/threonine-protein kinase [Solirubrobacterales bacterium]
MAELRAGDEFAGYRVEGVVARGGMGVVYRATQLDLDRTVALKLIAPEFAEDKQFRARFSRESQTAASIEHPNVIPIYEAGEEDGVLYLVMRFVAGSDLYELIEKEGPMDLQRAVGIIEQVAEALDAAHEKGLVHRDVKPRNILVVSQGGRERVYLTDFGLTKSTASTSQMTRTGQWLGTVDYVPPEQIEGGHLDARSDVYALGCVLYECLAGRVPFARDSEVARLFAHVKDPPPQLSAQRPDLPKALDEVIERAMSKAPEDRYPSAGDLGRALAAAARGTSDVEDERSVASGEAAPGATRIAATREHTAPATAIRPAATEELPSPATGLRGLIGQKRVWIPALTAIGLLGIVLAVVIASGGGGPGPGPEPGPTPAITEPEPEPEPALEPEPAPEPESTTGNEPITDLKAHFSLLVQGRYEEAAADLTQYSMEEAGGRATWIRQEEEDQLQSANLDAFVSQYTEDGTAIVQVRRLHTEALNSGCNNFAGLYSMVRSGSRWLIAYSDLNRASC